jgi:hypothetical protein
MERTAVKSSNIKSLGYDETTQKLEVEFKAGGLYQYAAVPKGLYERFMSAPSKGRFFDQNVKEKFRTSKIR